MPGRTIKFQQEVPKGSRVFEQFYREELRRIGADNDGPAIRSRIVAWLRAVVRYGSLLW